MVNILVPTDFSTLSKVAVRYAMRIAARLGGNVTLLHVIDLQTAVRSAGFGRTDLRETRDRLEELVKKIAMDDDEVFPVIKFKISRGTTFVDTVMKESRRLRSGLIVMGTKGASGLKKTFLGSNTASLIGSSHIPVLAVPRKASFRSFRNVIYATDLKNAFAELSLLKQYVEMFKATLHVLHVVDDGSKVDEKEREIEAVLKNLAIVNAVTLVTMDHEVEAAISSYISVSRADLVAMFTRRPTFYEKLMDKSVTRKLALHSNIPLLAFRQGDQNSALPG